MANTYVPENHLYTLDTGSETVLAAGKYLRVSGVLHVGGSAGNSAVLTDGNDKAFITTITGNPAVMFKKPRTLNGLKTGTIAGGTVYLFLAEPGE
jgi:hypothetical protein